MQAQTATEGRQRIIDRQLHFLALAFAGVFGLLFFVQHIIHRVEEWSWVQIEQRNNSLLHLAALRRKRFHPFVDDLEFSCHVCPFCFASRFVEVFCRWRDPAPETKESTIAPRADRMVSGSSVQTSMMLARAGSCVHRCVKSVSWSTESF